MLGVSSSNTLVRHGERAAIFQILWISRLLVNSLRQNAGSVKETVK
jgi:hypothetical protein